MWQTHGPSSAPAAGTVAFGKIPKMGDFLRVGQVGRGGESLHDWIEQGMASAEGKRGAAWATAYAAGAPWAFLFRPPPSANAPEALVGVMKPSVDAVGRKFPLVVFAPALPRPVAPWPHVLPMVFGDFLDAAATVLLASDSLTSAADMQNALRSVPAPVIGDAEPTAREYEAWTAATPLQHAWAVIYGGSGEAAHRAIHTIVEAVAPFRGEVAPQTKLSLRLPLGAGGAAACALWIDIVRQLARSLSEVRTCFWHTDGVTGSLIIQLGTTPASSLGELWAPDTGSDFMCDLTVPASVDVGRMLGRLPPPIAEVLQAPQALVQDFLARLIF